MAGLFIVLPFTQNILWPSAVPIELSFWGSFLIVGGIISLPNKLSDPIMSQDNVGIVMVVGGVIAGLLYGFGPVLLELSYALIDWTKNITPTELVSTVLCIIAILLGSYIWNRRKKDVS